VTETARPKLPPPPALPPTRRWEPFIEPIAQPVEPEDPGTAQYATDYSLEPPRTLERLREGPPPDRLIGWLVTLGITALAFVIRFVNFDYPPKLIFDETFYAKDAWTLWKFGYETTWPDDANEQILAGNWDVYNTDPSYVVHPPVGKWLIGFGEQLFGLNSFGWRFMPLIFGTLLIFFTIRLARRLSRSTLIGGIAGLLLTCDGLAFIMSRIALLDIFQAVFLVAAVSCCLADRDWYRHRLADILERRGKTDFGGRFGPLIFWRPWRLASGVLFGLACGTKWNSLYLLAVMGIVSVIWDVGARRLAGAGWRAWFGLYLDGIPAYLMMVMVAVVVYTATWTGWLVTDGGYYRDWAAENPTDPLAMYVPDPWASWLHYHEEAYSFHTGQYMKEQTHPYSSHPLTWLLMLRPIGIDWTGDIETGVDGCTAEVESCVRVINGMGTPVLWWLAAAAIVICIIWRIGNRDWRFSLPVIAMAATYLPWYLNADRPIFFFYTITMVPFTVIGLAMCLGLLIGPAHSRFRRTGTMIAGVLIGLVVANFAFIYPVLTDQLIYRSAWMARMWLASWI
jgi:dolichyl-phosphate-mannose--protein O-mannosyl transferase